MCLLLEVITLAFQDFLFSLKLQNLIQQPKEVVNLSCEQSFRFSHNC